MTTAGSPSATGAISASQLDWCFIAMRQPPAGTFSSPRISPASPTVALSKASTVAAHQRPKRMLTCRGASSTGSAAVPITAVHAKKTRLNAIERISGIANPASDANRGRAAAVSTEPARAPAVGAGETRMSHVRSPAATLRAARPPDGPRRWRPWRRPVADALSDLPHPGSSRRSRARGVVRLADAPGRSSHFRRRYPRDLPAPRRRRVVPPDRHRCGLGHRRDPAARARGARRVRVVLRAADRRPNRPAVAAIAGRLPEAQRLGRAVPRPAFQPEPDADLADDGREGLFRRSHQYRRNLGRGDHDPFSWL